MRVLHWCMMGVTILLLVCEVTVSQLCKSLITLVDGFHTLFIFMGMALPPPQTAGMIKPPPSSLDYLASPPHASPSAAAPPPTLPAGSSIKPSPGTTDGSSTLNEPPAAPHNREAASPFNSHQLCFPEVSPPALDCGVSYANSRVQAVGAFISSLLLASLCTSYLIEIISFSLEPHPVQRPLLLVVVGALSLFHKIQVLWLNWDQLLEDRARARAQPETESYLEVNHEVLAEEKETIGLAEPGRVLDGVGRVQAAVNDSLHNGALVLCNPGTSSIPDTLSQTPQQRPEVHLRAADSQNASKTFPVCKSSCHTESPVPSSQWPVWLLSFFLVIQGLLSSLLALVNSLVMLLVDPQCLHSSGACSLLVYLDPGLSLLAVIMLIAASMPQVHRYGLLLLQATPPHICVSDLGRRIASVPGVQAVHDLHIWQLTESFTVASVHVHCHAGFPAHRCADLMSGVTKVLQSVGVSCCTVQPEFASCSGCSAGSGSDASPVVHREDPSLPPLLACSLACGKACTGNMSCSPTEVKTRSLLAPPTGETKEEPQTLVIENTFL